MYQDLTAGNWDFNFIKVPMKDTGLGTCRVWNLRRIVLLAFPAVIFKEENLECAGSWP